jgi:hypothetical protein
MHYALLNYSDVASKKHYVRDTAFLLRERDESIEKWRLMSHGESGGLEIRRLTANVTLTEIKGCRGLKGKLAFSLVQCILEYLVKNIRMGRGS